MPRITNAVRASRHGGRPKSLPGAWARTIAKAAISLAVAAALHAQTPPDPSDILNRARFQITEAMRRLPKYTCVETIDRAYFMRPRAIDCNSGSDELKRGRTPLTLQATDRVRLDVAQGELQEIHSWPGATRFDTQGIDQLIERGPASTGGFGGYLIDIFDNGGAQFSFVGAKDDAGRRVFTYGYRVDEELSNYKVRTDEGWVTAGYDGTFDIDVSSLELLRLTLSTLQLPRSTGLCSAQNALEYAPVRIGDGDFLLPRESKLHLSHMGTLETNSTSVFANCREYRPEPPSPPPTAADAASNSRLSLPEGTKLRLHLNAAIDSDTAAAGDPVEATILDPVRDPKVGAVLLPAGGIVHGRITRMEHWLAPKRMFVIAIHWDSIAQAGDSAPLAALLPERRPQFACSGQSIAPSYAIPGSPMTAGVIEGRHPPSLPELREVLPLVPTNGRRCIVPDDQPIWLVVTRNGGTAPALGKARK